MTSSRILAIKSVDYIIKRYCEDYIGSDFIWRGEYRMLCAEDSQVIENSRFATIASSGTKFEISIVMRQTENFRRKCPRCGNSNYSGDVICGWIKWQVLLESLCARVLCYRLQS
jgi:hypothetical protein